jgi:hypothetical protein
MKVLSQLLGLCLLVALVGCSGTVSDTEVEVTPQEPPAKAMLEGIAESGVVGSGAMQIREALETMKAEGHPKADELLADLNELETTTNPAQVKSKASAMAAKL